MVSQDASVSVFRRFGRRMGRLRKSRRGLILLNLFLWGGLGLLSLGAYEASSQDWFCSTCHIMAEPVATHARSAHRQTSCAQCHLPDGFLARAGHKLSNLGGALAYMLGAEDTGDRVAIPDTSCLRSGCHSRATRDGGLALLPEGIRFPHDKHDRRSDGSAMSCLTCHNQADALGHMNLDMAACRLCHFKSREQGKLGDCRLCHVKGSPVVAVTLVEEDRPFFHGRYYQKDTDCRLCHVGVVQGEGALLQGSGPDGFQGSETAAQAHGAWSRDKGFDCSACHGEVEHRRQRARDALHAEPDLPEGGLASPSAGLYQGETEGVEIHPDRMFRRGVSCTACHGARTADAMKVNPRTCENCHEKGMAGLLAVQRKVYRQWTANIDAGWKARRAGLADQWGAEKTRAFEKSLALLRSGAWIHNLPAARNLIAQAETALADGEGEDWRPLLKPVWEVSRADRACFWRCHLDVPFKDEAGEDPLVIPHRRHLETVQVRCRRCHREEAFDQEPELHGRLTVRRSDCLRCHHLETESRTRCEACHKAQNILFQGEGAPGAGVLRRKNCPSAACKDCHRMPEGTDSPSQVRAACADCHNASREVTLRSWQEAVDRRLDPLRERLFTLERELASKGSGQEKAHAALTRARELIDLVRKDGSRGAHNIRYTLKILSVAAARLDEAEKAK